MPWAMPHQADFTPAPATTRSGSTGLCCEDWGVETLIKPVQHGEDGALGGHYRSTMTPEHLASRSYGRRWHIESFITEPKRTTGSAFNALSDGALHAEAALRARPTPFAARELFFISASLQKQVHSTTLA